MEERGNKKNMKWLIHCNLVNLRVVSLVIIVVEGSLSKGKGSTDGLRVLEILRCCCQVLVDVVHGQNHSADVGHVM